jgi:beta-phosphoglucomutase-like phosphatase (HAD superfamily)
MIPSPRAVLFDLDGTLADTIEDLGGAFNRVLESHGYPVFPVERYKTMVGNGFLALTRRAIPPKPRPTIPWWNASTPRRKNSIPSTFSTLPVPFREYPNCLQP